MKLYIDSAGSGEIGNRDTPEMTDNDLHFYHDEEEMMTVGDPFGPTRVPDSKLYIDSAGSGEMGTTAPPVKLEIVDTGHTHHPSSHCPSGCLHVKDQTPARIRETLEAENGKVPNIEALLEKLILAMRASDNEAVENEEDSWINGFYQGKANAFWACYVQLKQAMEADTCQQVSKTCDVGSSPPGAFW